MSLIQNITNITKSTSRISNSRGAMTELDENELQALMALTINAMKTRGLPLPLQLFHQLPSLT
jgi:hypothetical protein